MRTLFNKKDFLPDGEKESKHIKGISKKDLLADSCDSDKAQIKVTFRATKAKIASIRHTLTLVHQLGIENREKLKEQLGQ